MKKQSDWLFGLINIKSDLERFLTDDYKDYKYGKPSEAAKALIEKTKQLDSILLSMKKDLDLAGDFLAPGMKQSLVDDINKLISRHFEGL